MSKLFQMTTAALFAAVAATSLYSLATAAPGGADAAPQNCEKAFCLVAFF